MRVGKVAQALGVDTKTVTNWSSRPELKDFFSTSATDMHKGTERDFSEDDLYVLNTIKNLRATMPRKNTDWHLIAQRLAEGYRDKELPMKAATVDSGLTVMAHAERILITSQERDMALQRVQELQQALIDREAKIDALQSQQQAMQEQLLRELADIKAELAAAKTELDLFRSGRLRPE